MKEIENESLITNKLQKKSNPTVHDYCSHSSNEISRVIGIRTDSRKLE